MDKKIEQTILQMYEKRRSLKSIQQKTGLTTKKIKEWLIANKKWTGHRALQFYYNEFFFDKIDSEEKAYWLGFLYADGYLAYPSTIGVELKATDGSHLEKFKASLEAEQNVKYYTKNSTFGPQKNCRFSFASKHMFKILLSYFHTVHKSTSGCFPIEVIPNNLIHHFIRGFFDGDGCLTGKPKDDNHVFRPSLGFIGTKETLSCIEEISGFKWSWSQRVTNKEINNYQIGCGRVNDCLSFLHFMYSDATIYLDRKHDLYIYLLENREKNQAKARV